MSIWHKNGTEDMTQWSFCTAPNPCYGCGTWPDKEMCAGEPGGLAVSTEPTPNPNIVTPHDLGRWQEWLGEAGGLQAAITDSHDRPRLMSEGEDGVMYVTSPYTEDDENIWTKADVELWAYGPFTVVHPKADADA